METYSNKPDQYEQIDSSARQARSAISQEFQDFLADIETLFQSTTSLTGEDLDQAKTQINERIAAAKAKVEEVSDSVTYQARKTIAMADNYVHEQPWKAVGVGVGVGILLGLIFKRRS